MATPHALVTTYIPVCVAIGKLFAEYVEVVLHDLALEKIVHIENVFSHRQVGEASLVCLETLEHDADAYGVVGPYEKINSDGSSLKSITTIIYDPQRQAVGLLCINFKTASLKMANELLTALVHLPRGQAQTPPASLFQQDWQAQVNALIRQVLTQNNSTLLALKRAEKFAILQAVEQAGMFAIRGSSQYVARVLGISRANLYEMLKKIRQP